MARYFVVTVNRHRIAANRRRIDGHRDPVFRVSKGRSGKPAYYHRVLLDGGVLLDYAPDHPLPCGATAWIEADRVRVLDENGRLVEL